MGSKISVVGMACVYAGAGNLEQFWETVLTRRKGFRAIPPGRLRLDDYASEHRHERDKTYVKQAAVVDGYRFDWKTHRVPKSAFEATDPSHWLALSTALQAFDDSGADLDAIGRDRVGVILGNSLTGEVTRANMLRLRWPYVRQAIAAGARRSGMPDSDLSELLAEVEQNFKAPFPVPNEDTLAGALANVIAGRICNVLNLGGGGYTVDGACASSLLAVSAACEALEAGRLDMVLAGGVDISLDPLELVGFARTGALADGAMRVYDKNAGGFLPGEGCGLLVLMREPDMKRHGLKPWAHIAGWGISSDGAGGITAPKSDGQALAMRRCYRHAGFSPTELDFIEGHGTGTPVGDEQELNGFLAITEHEGGPSDLRRTGVTSVKTLVGHTKAAAGAAGLIKAVLGVNQRVLAPMAGPRDPAAAFEHSNARIYPIAKGNCLPRKSELKAGVAGAGFGGINCHVAVTGEDVAVRPLETRDADWLLASPQDAEVFVASADDNTGLAERLKALLGRSDGMAEGELVDLAADCAFRDTGAELRVAIVAGTVAELRSRFQALSDLLRTHTAEVLPAPLPPGCVLGRVKPGVRIGLLFPGQGSQFVGMGSILASRSDWAAARRTEWDSRFAELGPDGLSSFIDRPLERANGPEVRQGWTEALRDTAVAQPAIVMTGLQWLHWLRRLGVNFSAVLGHSLGEIGAMVAAQLLSEAEAMEVVRIRAGACADRQIPDGGMLALNCSIQTAESLAKDAGHLATIANDNAPEQAVLAGETQGLEKIAAIARSRGIRTTRLQVSKAFHTEHMAPAAEALNAFAGTRGEQRQAAVPFYSCVQGGPAPTVFDPFAYAAEQITAPVRFREAVRAMAETCDILVELGPGEVLTGLARKTLGDTYPVCALEPAAGDYDGRFCTAVGRLYVAGAALDWDAFYRERYWRPFVPAAERSFIENPCCSAETPFIPEPARSLAEAPQPETFVPQSGNDVEELLRTLVAHETGFDMDMISPDACLARDLNLDSIKIAEVRAELKVRGIELPEDLAMGALPIRAIARAASCREVPAQGIDHTETRAGIPLPQDLPVLGYRRLWQAVPPVIDTPTVTAATILYAADRADAAARLAEKLAALGVRIRLLGQHESGAPFIDERLIALPGALNDAAAVSDFFARLGAESRYRSLVLIGLPNSAPVFGFAQSLSLERPELPILALEAEETANLPNWASASIAPGVRLVKLAADGALAPALEPWVPAEKAHIPLQPGDVVLVSGGAKGIAAECTFALLEKTGARAILLGTSPEQTPGAEVERTLARFAEAGLDALYLQCDVTDEDAIRAALRRAENRIGTANIAGLIHGAGINHPAPAARLDARTVDREYRVKVGGLANLLAALDTSNLKLCVGLGSVIGTLGLHGNSAYALANEAMASMLNDLKRRHPALHVACPAFSVWSEVGMGAKLNVLETLARQHIAAIPVAEGIRWFLHACGRHELPLPLVVAAPMHGLPTFRQARGTEQEPAGPYLDGRVVHEPGTVLVSRPVLNPERDAWLKDHAFRGTLLFATVQALLAMGSGTRVLAGAGKVTRFEALEIVRPIVAAQRGDTRIELDVRREPDGTWNTRVGEPGTARPEPAFAARCRLGMPNANTDRFDAAKQTPGNWQPVADEAGAHLYRDILFQGSLFRRIEQVIALDLSEKPQRRGRFRVRREASAEELPIPDPFFLDALLQSLQVLVPRDRCLPVGIAEIEFYAAAWEAGDTLVQAEIVERTEDGYRARIKAWNLADGRPVARFDDYRVKIVEHHAQRPDADALFEPLHHDRTALAGWLAAQDAGIDCQVALGAVDESNREQRRAAAAAQIAAQLGAAESVLRWNAAGAPELAGMPGRSVAVSHDAGRLLTVCGDKRVGCDLQSVGNTPRDWAGILPKSRQPLWQELVTALHNREHAGILVWALHEALVKAGAANAAVSFAGLENGKPRFRLAEGKVNAGLVQLALAGPTAIALVRVDTGESPYISHFSRDLEMTFKEVLPPLISPTASVFYGWMGALREEAMSDIRTDLARAFGKGGKAMVTNGTRLTIAAPIAYATPLRAWVWLERVSAGQPSSFELGFQWAETDAAGMPVRIVAEGLQRLTWVDAGGSAPVPEPFPDFFADFIVRRQPADGHAYNPPLGRLLPVKDRKPLIWRRSNPAAGFGTTRLTLETDETHSNFVGNIYFAHLATLAERVCQKLLRRLGWTAGGFYATELRLDHLGEAVPGDTLEAEARLSQVAPDYCVLELVLTNTSRGKTKVAAGRARYRLYASDAGEHEALPMPAWLIPSSVEEAV